MTTTQILFSLSGMRRWAIVNALAEHGPLRLLEISKLIRENESSTSNDMRILVASGIVVRVPECGYTLQSPEEFALLKTRLTTYREAIHANHPRS